MVFLFFSVMMAMSVSCSIMACLRLVVLPVIPLAFVYSIFMLLLVLVFIFLLGGLLG